MPDAPLITALASPEVSVRLAAALRAGTEPSPSYVEALVERCGVEPDFFVRDMLTWALTRHDRTVVLDRVLAELTAAAPQSRAQALHTISKIGTEAHWSAIPRTLLFDSDDTVARTAWRTAAGIAPRAEWGRLARDLATQLGRGPREVRLSLSQAMVALGDAAEQPLQQAAESSDPAVRAHAAATQRLAAHPDQAFDDAIDQAIRAHVLQGAPIPPAAPQPGQPLDD